MVVCAAGEAGITARVASAARGAWVAGARGWGDCVETHKDHGWPLLCGHTQAETRLHSGEPGVELMDGGVGSAPQRPQDRHPPSPPTAEWLQQQAHPQWRQRAVVVEGEVVQLRDKLQEAWRATRAAEAERDHLGAWVKELEARRPKGQVQQQQQQTGAGTRAEVGGLGLEYLPGAA